MMLDLCRSTWTAAYEADLESNPLLIRLDAMVSSGIFRSDDGAEEDLKDAKISRDQAMLLYYLARQLEADLTIETGFGVGTSALAMLAAKRKAPVKQKHVSIDPFGLPGGRGKAVLEFIERTFPDQFERHWEHSEYALPKLCQSGMIGQLRLAYIDGGHLFDHAFMDFVYFDRLLAPGGWIAIDDTQFPAMETVVNFVRANKANYAVHPVLRNLVVMRKTAAEDGRAWNHFRPFDVPQRQNWTAA